MSEKYYEHRHDQHDSGCPLSQCGDLCRVEVSCCCDWTSISPEKFSAEDEYRLVSLAELAAHRTDPQLSRSLTEAREALRELALTLQGDLDADDPTRISPETMDALAKARNLLDANAREGK